MTRRLALALVGLAALAPPAPSQDFGPRRILPTRASLERIGLEKMWYTAIPRSSITEKVATLNLAEDLLFVQTNAGYLHVYEAETGKPLWNILLGAQTLDTRPATVNSDSVFVTNNRTLHCLDRKTGRTNWVADLGLTVANVSREGATAVGVPAATETRVMVGLAGGKIVAFNARKVDPTIRTAARSAGTLAWTWQTNGPITGRPIPAERVVAFGSQDNKVYVCIDTPPTLLYRYLTAGPVSASMGTHGERTLIVPSEDHVLYGVDLFTGDTKWTVPTGAPLRREPLVAGDTIFIINAVGEAYSIDARNGTILWSQRTPASRIVALAGSQLFLGTIDHDIVVLDRSTGRMVSNSHETRERIGLDLRNFTIDMTNRQNDRLYLASTDGFVVALRHIGAARPTNLRDPKGPKFGHIPDGGIPDVVTPPVSPPAETPPAEADKPPAAEKPAS